MSPEQDFVVADHTLLSRLGKGGMATVYLAREERLGRLVALKVIDERFDGDEHFRKRFEREARTAAGLTHANIVPIYQYGFTDQGRPFLSMAYLDGGSLRDRLRKRGSLPLDEALAITRQVAQGLHAAHVRSIVHRDLKPDNVMFQGDTAMLTDFGIAKVLDASTELTSTGVNPGTVKYFSPEQAFERPVDQRSDIYTLGVVLYEMLTGHVPIEADSIVTFMMRIAHQPPDPLPAELRGVQPFMDLLLVKEPERRLQSCAEVVAVIQAMERNWARFGNADRLTDGIALVAGTGVQEGALAAATAASDDATMLIATPAAIRPGPLTPGMDPAGAVQARIVDAETLAPTVAMAGVAAAAGPATGAAPSHQTEAVGTTSVRTGTRRWLSLGAGAAAILAGIGWFALRPDVSGPDVSGPDIAAMASGVPVVAAASEPGSAVTAAVPGAAVGAGVAASASGALASAPDAGSAEVPFANPASVDAQPSVAGAVPALLPADGAGAANALPAVLLGDLRVSVNVPARVRVGGVLRGEARPGRPIFVRGVQVGAVDVEVRARGYETQVERIFVSSDAAVELSVQLEPNADALLSGRWEGSYGYRDGRAPVPMAVDFRVQGGDVGGTSSEANTFGAGQGPLTAILTGSLRGNILRFVKTYDGSGGQSHSVTYQGVVDADGGRIRGTWNLAQARGVFSLERR